MAESTCSRPHNRLIFAAGIHSIFGIYSDIQSVALNYLHVPLKPFLNQSFYVHYGIALNTEDFQWVWGMTASCNFLGMLLSGQFGKEEHGNGSSTDYWTVSRDVNDDCKAAGVFRMFCCGVCIGWCWIDVERRAHYLFSRMLSGQD
jgi:hypothetical protein